MDILWYKNSSLQFDSLEVLCWFQNSATLDLLEFILSRAPNLGELSLDIYYQDLNSPISDLIVMALVQAANNREV